MHYHSPAVAVCFALSIPGLYAEYHKLTGSEIAAALLTLAAVHAEPEGAPEPLLTVRQAAKKLNVSTRTIYDAVHSGQLKHRRLGTGRGTLRFTAEDVESFRPGRSDEMDPDFAALLRGES